MDPQGLSEPELHAVVALWARTGRTIEARFTGTSMEPAIPHGSTLRLHCGRAPRPGDVIAFVRDGHVLLHRLVAQDRGVLLTRGDAFVVPDPPLAGGTPFACVVGLRQGGAWIEPPIHTPSAAQATVLSLCLAAGRIHPRLGRLASGALRRLGRRRAPPPLELRE